MRIIPLRVAICGKPKLRSDKYDKHPTKDLHKLLPGKLMLNEWKEGRKYNEAAVLPRNLEEMSQTVPKKKEKLQ